MTPDRPLRRPNSSWPPNRLCSASMRPCAAFSSKACPRSRSPLASAIPQEPSASSVISFAMISASAPASFRRFAGGLKRRPPAIGCGNGPSPCASETSRSTISNASWPPPAIPCINALSILLREEGFARLPRRRDEQRPAPLKPEAAAIADVRQINLAPRSFRKGSAVCFCSSR